MRTCSKTEYAFVESALISVLRSNGSNPGSCFFSTYEQIPALTQPNEKYSRKSEGGSAQNDESSITPSFSGALRESTPSVWERSFLDVHHGRDGEYNERQGEHDEMLFAKSFSSSSLDSLDDHGTYALCEIVCDPFLFYSGTPLMLRIVVVPPTSSLLPLIQSPGTPLPGSSTSVRSCECPHVVVVEKRGISRLAEEGMRKDTTSTTEGQSGTTARPICSPSLSSPPPPPSTSFLCKPEKFTKSDDQEAGSGVGPPPAWRALYFPQRCRIGMSAYLSSVPSRFTSSSSVSSCSSSSTAMPMMMEATTMATTTMGAAQEGGDAGRRRAAPPHPLSFHSVRHHVGNASPSPSCRPLWNFHNPSRASCNSRSNSADGDTTTTTTYPPSPFNKRYEEVVVRDWEMSLIPFPSQRKNRIETMKNEKKEEEKAVGEESPPHNQRYHHHHPLCLHMEDANDKGKGTPLQEVSPLFHPQEMNDEKNIIENRGEICSVLEIPFNTLFHIATVLKASLSSSSTSTCAPSFSSSSLLLSREHSSAKDSSLCSLHQKNRFIGPPEDTFAKDKMESSSYTLSPPCSSPTLRLFISLRFTGGGEGEGDRSNDHEITDGTRYRATTGHVHVRRHHQSFPSSSCSHQALHPVGPFKNEVNQSHSGEMEGIDTARSEHNRRAGSFSTTTTSPTSTTTSSSSSLWCSSSQERKTSLCHRLQQVRFEICFPNTDEGHVLHEKWKCRHNHACYDPHHDHPQRPRPQSQLAPAVQDNTGLGMKLESDKGKRREEECGTFLDGRETENKIKVEEGVIEEEKQEKEETEEKEEESLGLTTTSGERSASPKYDVVEGGEQRGGGWGRQSYPTSCGDGGDSWRGVFDASIVSAVPMPVRSERQKKNVRPVRREVEVGEVYSVSRENHWEGLVKTGVVVKEGEGEEGWRKPLLATSSCVSTLTNSYDVKEKDDFSPSPSPPSSRASSLLLPFSPSSSSPPVSPHILASLLRQGSIGSNAAKKVENSAVTHHHHSDPNPPPLPDEDNDANTSASSSPCASSTSVVASSSSFCERSLFPSSNARGASNGAKIRQTTRRLPLRDERIRKKWEEETKQDDHTCDDDEDRIHKGNDTGGQISEEDFRILQQVLREEHWMMEASMMKKKEKKIRKKREGGCQQQQHNAHFDTARKNEASLDDKVVIKEVIIEMEEREEAETCGEAVASRTREEERYQHAIEEHDPHHGHPPSRGPPPPPLPFSTTTITTCSSLPPPVLLPPTPPSSLPSRFRPHSLTFDHNERARVKMRARASTDVGVGSDEHDSREGKKEEEEKDTSTSLHPLSPYSPKDEKSVKDEEKGMEWSFVSVSSSSSSSLNPSSSLQPTSQRLHNNNNNNEDRDNDQTAGGFLETLTSTITTSMPATMTPLGGGRRWKGSKEIGVPIARDDDAGKEEEEGQDHCNSSSSTTKPFSIPKRRNDEEQEEKGGRVGVEKERVRRVNDSLSSCVSSSSISSSMKLTVPNERIGMNVKAMSNDEAKENEDVPPPPGAAIPGTVNVKERNETNGIAEEGKKGRWRVGMHMIKVKEEEPKKKQKEEEEKGKKECKREEEKDANFHNSISSSASPSLPSTPPSPFSLIVKDAMRRKSQLKEALRCFSRAPSFFRVETTNRDEAGGGENEKIKRGIKQKEERKKERGGKGDGAIKESIDKEEEGDDGNEVQKDHGVKSIFLGSKCFSLSPSSRSLPFFHPPPPPPPRRPPPPPPPLPPTTAVSTLNARGLSSSCSSLLKVEERGKRTNYLRFTWSRKNTNRAPSAPPWTSSFSRSSSSFCASLSPPLRDPHEDFKETSQRKMTVEEKEASKVKLIPHLFYSSSSSLPTSRKVSLRYGCSSRTSSPPTGVRTGSAIPVAAAVGGSGVATCVPHRGSASSSSSSRCASIPQPRSEGHFPFTEGYCHGDQDPHHGTRTTSTSTTMSNSWNMNSNKDDCDRGGLMRMWKGKYCTQAFRVASPIPPWKERRINSSCRSIRDFSPRCSLSSPSLPPPSFANVSCSCSRDRSIPVGHLNNNTSSSAPISLVQEGLSPPLHDDDPAHPKLLSLREKEEQECKPHRHFFHTFMDDNQQKSESHGGEATEKEEREGRKMENKKEPITTTSSGGRRGGKGQMEEEEEGANKTLVPEEYTRSSRRVWFFDEKKRCNHTMCEKEQKRSSKRDGSGRREKYAHPNHRTRSPSCSSSLSLSFPSSSTSSCSSHDSCHAYREIFSPKEKRDTHEKTDRTKGQIPHPSHPHPHRVEKGRQEGRSLHGEEHTSPSFPSSPAPSSSKSTLKGKSGGTPSRDLTFPFRSCSASSSRSSTTVTFSSSSSSSHCCEAGRRKSISFPPSHHHFHRRNPQDSESSLLSSSFCSLSSSCSSTTTARTSASSTENRRNSSPMMRRNSCSRSHKNMSCKSDSSCLSSPDGKSGKSLLFRKMKSKERAKRLGRRNVTRSGEKAEDLASDGGGCRDGCGNISKGGRDARRSRNDDNTKEEVEVGEEEDYGGESRKRIEMGLCSVFWKHSSLETHRRVKFLLVVRRTIDLRGGEQKQEKEERGGVQWRKTNCGLSSREENRGEDGGSPFLDFSSLTFSLIKIPEGELKCRTVAVGDESGENCSVGEEGGEVHCQHRHHHCHRSSSSSFSHLSPRGMPQDRRGAVAAGPALGWVNINDFLWFRQKEKKEQFQHSHSQHIQDNNNNNNHNHHHRKAARGKEGKCTFTSFSSSLYAMNNTRQLRGTTRTEEVRRDWLWERLLPLLPSCIRKALNPTLDRILPPFHFPLGSSHLYPSSSPPPTPSSASPPSFVVSKDGREGREKKQQEQGSSSSSHPSLVHTRKDHVPHLGSCITFTTSTPSPPLPVLFSATPRGGDAGDGSCSTSTSSHSSLCSTLTRGTGSTLPPPPPHPSSSSPSSSTSSSLLTFPSREGTGMGISWLIPGLQCVVGTAAARYCPFHPAVSGPAGDEVGGGATCGGGGSGCDHQDHHHRRISTDSNHHRCNGALHSTLIQNKSHSVVVLFRGEVVLAGEFSRRDAALKFCKILQQ